MIVSVHVADVGLLAVPKLLRARLDPRELPGLQKADTAIVAPMSGRLLPAPTPGRVGPIAGWEDDSALDRFLAGHPLATRLADGWHVRLRPIRVSGAWSDFPALPDQETPIEEGEPVAVLTLGRLKVSNALRFLRTTAPAEGLAVRNPVLLASTVLARPPRLVATFSLWSTAAGMRAYAYGQAGSEHLAAIRAHRARPFHHESAFIRCRPYGAGGAMDVGQLLPTARDPAQRDEQG
jgi:hypothetical protein